MRRPAVAGQFYPQRRQELAREIEEHLSRADISQIACTGAVVPHAGYMYSGPVAAYAYKALPKAETYVILGPNHRGGGSAVAVSTEKWSTPLGEVEVDLDFINAMPMQIIDRDENAHRYEHSLEVQLPFLQYLFKDFKIVPVCLGLQDEMTAIEVGSEVSEAVKKTGKKVIILASSDFSHYEPDQVARVKDRYFIDAILKLDIAELYLRLSEKDATVCGYGAIAALIQAGKNLGAKKGELLKYGTSGDIIPDRSEVVGYAAIVIK